MDCDLSMRCEIVNTVWSRFEFDTAYTFLFVFIHKVKLQYQISDLVNSPTQLSVRGNSLCSPYIIDAFVETWARKWFGFFNGCRAVRAQIIVYGTALRTCFEFRIEKLKGIRIPGLQFSVSVETHPCFDVVKIFGQTFFVKNMCYECMWTYLLFYVIVTAINLKILYYYIKFCSFYNT